MPEKAAVAAEDQPKATVNQILTSWFNQHINNSPVARHGEAYHHVRNSLKPLEELLKKNLQ